MAGRVFEGNTADPSTIYDQINLLKSRFDIEEVVWVGDRGMIKAKGKHAINHEGWKYITALTNAQTRTRLTQGVLQADLFDHALREVEHGDKRLILRCNEAKTQREQQRRRDKLNTLQLKIDQRNHAVKDSPRAQPETGLKQLQAGCKRHKLSAVVTLLLEGRLLRHELDEAALEEHAKLDGGYVLETDVPSSVMDKTTIEARYRDLQRVERNFRTMKTGLLEGRPIYLRQGARTHAHVFIAMLALKVARVFEARLRRHFGCTDTDENAMTVSDALQTLSRIIFLNYQTKDHVISRLTALDEKQIALLNALQIPLPKKTAKLL